MSRQCGVMLIPAPLPSLPETAHLTVVYGGEDANDFLLKQLSQLTNLMASCTNAFSARQLGFNFQFGDNHDEPVILLALTPELTQLRLVFERFSKSSYTEFRPHVAVPEARDYVARGWQLPSHLYFNKIEVWLDSAAVASYWLGTGAST